MEEFMDKETCVAFYEDTKVNARHSRIEARFEELIRREFGAHEMPAHWPIAMGAAWDAAVAVESFLESKRAEVKDGK